MKILKVTAFLKPFGNLFWKSFRETLGVSAVKARDGGGQYLKSNRCFLVWSSESCSKGVAEAPLLTVEDVDQKVVNGRTLNIPQIITTPEPEADTLAIPEYR